MAAPLLRKGIPLLRLRLQRYNLLAAGIPSSPRRPWCAAAESAGLEEEVSSAEKSSAVPSVRDPKDYHVLDDPDYRKWKDKEEEILRDIRPRILLARKILRDYRYKDGEHLTVADEEAVVEMLLRCHPDSVDKIGCGVYSIMVDRHPEFRHTRCLFVVRTDGGWIDFSYHECLRAYIQTKYPSHAERFIGEHFTRRRLSVWALHELRMIDYEFTLRQQSGMPSGLGSNSQVRSFFVLFTVMGTITKLCCSG